MKKSCVPIFAKIVDSSLWDEPDVVMKVFLTMLVKKDWDHVVRGNAYNIGQWAKKSEADVIKAIKVLCSPDTRRIEQQPFDGRRLQKVEGGWLILNGDYYHKLMMAELRREYKREWQAKKRAEKTAPKEDQAQIPEPLPAAEINAVGESAVDVLMARDGGGS